MYPDPELICSDTEAKTTDAGGDRRKFREKITLGTCGITHLGDTLCISPLPRLLRLHRGLDVFVSDYSLARAVFENNPHVRGFVTEAGVPLWARGRGDGHVIQRLLQSFELPIEAMPRPEVYLTHSERTWADGQRRTWPAGRPVCILSTGAVTDRDNLKRVAWQSAARILARYVTIVQPVLDEAPVPGAIVYRDLPIRAYMALMAVADCFVGGTSGGSHVAAAFDVPSLIVVWRALLRGLRFPASGLGPKSWFLYPQHWFIPAEDIAVGQFQPDVLDEAMRHLLASAPAGRATPLGNHPRSPAGIGLRASPRIAPAGRFRRVPASYGVQEEAPGKTTCMTPFGATSRE